MSTTACSTCASTRFFRHGLRRLIGTAERWIGSCRREMLDHIIPLNERHLRRLLREYASFHNDDRVHEALNQRCTNWTTSGPTAVVGRQHNLTASAWRPPSSLSLVSSRLEKYRGPCRVWRLEFW